MPRSDCKHALREGVQPHEKVSPVQAIAEMAAWLPLPVAREHIQVPLLLALPRRPDVALALIVLASTFGSAYAAQHIIPPLLAILSSRAFGAAGVLPSVPPLILCKLLYKVLCGHGASAVKSRWSLLS